MNFLLHRVILLAALLVALSAAHATPPGAVPLNPNGQVIPGQITSGTDPGTLLASLSAPFTTVDTSGTLLSAVYRENNGFLDFYYQISLNSTSGGNITRETDFNFSGFSTSVGYRTDGGSFGGPFGAGTIAPTSSDRNSSGSVVGFGFGPPSSNAIPPGATSAVLVISTNAINFTNGTASVIDGGATTVNSFAPAAAVPEPDPLVFLGLGGIAVLIAVGRRSA